MCDFFKVLESELIVIIEMFVEVFLDRVFCLYFSYFFRDGINIL